MSDLIRYWRLAAGAQATLGEAKIDAEGKDERRGFSMLAYTGDEVLLQLQMFAPPERVVFDLSGMSVKREIIPILAYHDIHQIAGQSSLIANNGERIDIQGHLSSTTDTGRMVAGLSDEGFPWEASIGLEATEIEEVAEGDTVELNGRTFDGPLVVARKFTLKESSFVPFGADSATSRRLTNRATHGQGERHGQGDSGRAEGRISQRPSLRHRSCRRRAHHRSCEGSRV